MKKENYRNDILVSAIITTRNRPKLLPLAIESVLNQTYELVEIIVVDDCSDYLTMSVMIQYLNKITFIQHHEIKGTSASRMSGVDRATGKYITFLDDDDQWSPEKIEKQLEVAESSGSNCAVVTCGAIIYSGNKKTFTYPTLEGPIRDRLFDSGFKTIPSNHFFNRRIFNLIGGYDSEFKSHEEHDIWMKLARGNYETYYIREPLVIIEENSRESKMSNTVIRIKSFEMFYRKWRNYVNGWYGEDEGKRIIKQYMISIYLMNASLLEEMNKSEEVRKISVKVFKYIMPFKLNTATIKVFYRLLYYFLPAYLKKAYKIIKKL